MRLIVFSLLFINLAIPAYFLGVPYLNNHVDTKKSASASVVARVRDEVKRPLEYSVSDKNNACYLLGPFVLESDAQAVEMRGMDLGIDAEVIEARELDYMLYRIMVPATSEQEKALSDLQVLQAGAIDSYMVQTDDQQYALSLGLFRSQESASQIQQAAFEVGVLAEVTEDPRYFYEYWYQVREIYKLSDETRMQIQGADQNLTWKFSDCRPDN